jgi:hypothetical protein
MPITNSYLLSIHTFRPRATAAGREKQTLSERASPAGGAPIFPFRSYVCFVVNP